MFDLPSISRLLELYPADCRPGSITALGSAGGFSGASFWRLETPAGRQLCLRRWPEEHPTPERLSFIHAALRHVQNELQGPGLSLPVPIATAAGRTFVPFSGALWELTPWLRGTADYRYRPSDARLEAALGALGRFHLAASTYLPAQPAAPSLGILERRDRLQELLSGGWKRLAARCDFSAWPELAPRRERLAAILARRGPAILAALERAATIAAPMQVCIRDIWHDHVLFLGDEVSGLVDFGAMRVDSVAGDVARLLRSLVLNDPRAWQTGLLAYRRVRPLSSDEEQLLAAYDLSTPLLSGANWLRWIGVEGREFAERPRVLARLDEALSRHETAFE